MNERASERANERTTAAKLSIVPWRIGLGQLQGGTTFLPEKYVRKINKLPEFYMILD